MNLLREAFDGCKPLFVAIAASVPLAIGTAWLIEATPFQSSLIGIGFSTAAALIALAIVVRRS